MVDPDLLDAARANGVRVHTFCKFALDDADYYFCDASRHIEYDGHTWLATGTFGKVEFSETEVSKMSGAMTLTLSGVFVGEDGAGYIDGLQEAISDTLTGTPLQGRSVTVFTAITNAAGNAVLMEQGFRMSGMIDTAEAVEDEAGGPSLQITIEDRAYRERIIEPRTYSLDDHQVINPGSTFLSQTAALASKDINWGKSA